MANPAILSSNKAQIMSKNHSPPLLGAMGMLSFQNNQAMPISLNANSAETAESKATMLTLNLEKKLAELSNKQVEKIGILARLQAEYDEIQHEQKMLKKERKFWQYLSFSSVRKTFNAKIAPLKEAEKINELVTKKYQLESQRVQAEISLIGNALLLNANKFAQEQSMQATHQALKEQTQRELNESNRLKVLIFLDSLSSFSDKRAEAEQQAEKAENSKAREAISKERRELYQNQLAEIVATPLALKLERAKAASVLFSETQNEIRQHLDQLEMQAKDLRANCAWYKCRPHIEKIELKEIKLLITQVKNVKKILNRTERKHQKEQQRLDKQQQRLNLLITSIQKMRAQPESLRMQPEFQQSIANLKAKKTQLENDESSAKARSGLVFKRVNRAHNDNSEEQAGALYEKFSIRF